MSENELKEVEVEEEVLDEEQPAEDTTDWKAKAQELERKAIEQRTRTRELKAKLAEAQKATTPAPKEEGFNYGEKAFLKASGIQSDEYETVYEAMQDTGKSLEGVLDSKWFTAELKEKREAKATKEAIPSGSKRSSIGTRDSVEYWIQKGELPPADQVELRRKVVNTKIKSEKQRSKFTDHPVV